MEKVSNDPPKTWDSLTVPYRSIMTRPIHIDILSSIDRYFEVRIYSKFANAPTTAYLAMTFFRALPAYCLMQLAPPALRKVALAGTVFYNWQKLDAVDKIQSTKVLHAVAIAVLVDGATILTSGTALITNIERLLFNAGICATSMALSTKTEASAR